MGKKVINTLLYVIMLAAAACLTVYIGQENTVTMIYNLVFLGIIAIIYLFGLIGGMYKMDTLTQAITRGIINLRSVFKKSGKAERESLPALENIFEEHYLDGKINNFVDNIMASSEGLGEIEDYINDFELDTHIHKRLLEMVPDILTSLGILGTFIGLVWGLKDFDPTGYEAMTTSVGSLVGGIKVAFLTSIYGVAFSIIYTYSFRNTYTALSEKLTDFLEKFHAYVLPTAENESRNLLIASQKQQTETMAQMATTFSNQLAESFEALITPTFEKMNGTLDLLQRSIAGSQAEAIQGILDIFLKEMYKAFGDQFDNFSQCVEAVKRLQIDNADYTRNLFQQLSTQLTDTYTRDENMMRTVIEEMVTAQDKYLDSANKFINNAAEIQKMQQSDYQHVTDYLREAERSSSKFWVACNQAMQKYVEAAAADLQSVADNTKVNQELTRETQKLVGEFSKNMQLYANNQQDMVKSMEQVRRLLSDIQVAGTEGVQLSAGRTSTQSSISEINMVLKRLNKNLTENAQVMEQQLDEMNTTLSELNKTSRQKKGIFR